MPTGNFVDDSGEDAGGATIGVTVLGEFIIPLGTPGMELVDLPGVGWVTSGSIIANGVNDDFRFSDDIDKGIYFNVPVLTDARFEAEVSSTVSAYGLGQAGLSFTKVPTFESDTGSKSTSGIAVGPAISIGGGADLNDIINVSLRFKRELDYEDELNGFLSPSVSLLQFVVGIGLN